MRGPGNFIVPPPFNFYFNPWNPRSPNHKLQFPLTKFSHITLQGPSSCKMSLKSENRLLSYGQNNFQYGGRLPRWILKIYIIWSRDCQRILNLLLYPKSDVFRWDCHDILLPHAKFHWNWTIGCLVIAKNNFQYGGRPTCWILKIYTLGHVTVTGLIGIHTLLNGVNSNEWPSVSYFEWQQSFQRHEHREASLGQLNFLLNWCHFISASDI